MLENTLYHHIDMPPDAHFAVALGKDSVKRLSGASEPPHVHSYLEIGYCYNGTGRVVLDDEEFFYTRGSFLIVPANRSHKIIPDDDSSSWEFLYIDTDLFLKTVYRNKSDTIKCVGSRMNYKPRLMNTHEYQTVALSILELFDIVRVKDDFYLDLARGVLLGIVIRLARLSPVRLRSATPEDEWVAFQVIDYVRQHYQEKIKPEDIFSSFDAQDSPLELQFARQMHMSAHDYIWLVRVEEACRLLKSSSESVSAIAEKCGFGELCDFNEKFKDFMGITPVEWRAAS